MTTETMYDLIIIGGGPAGYTAALYAARASLSTVVIEQGMPGGQIATSDMVENYPGVASISGSELGQKFQEHAEEFGAQTLYSMVTHVAHREDGTFEIGLDNGSMTSRALIVATGATPRPAGFDGEDAFRGRGVSYCATCDGMFYRNKDVFVVGGGNSAVEEALYLAKIAKSVTMIVRRDVFRAERGLVHKLSMLDNFSVRFNTSIVSVAGEQLLSSITFRDNQTAETYCEEYPQGSFGIFVFAGNDPVVDLVRDYVEIGPDGGVVTDESMATKTSGLYCIGDMRSKRLRQVVTAAADGAIAANAVNTYLEA